MYLSLFAIMSTTDVYFEKASEEGGSAEGVPAPVTRVSFEN